MVVLYGVTLPDHLIIPFIGLAILLYTIIANLVSAQKTSIKLIFTTFGKRILIFSILLLISNLTLIKYPTYNLDKDIGKSIEKNLKIYYLSGDKYEAFSSLKSELQKEPYISDKEKRMEYLLRYYLILHSTGNVSFHIDFADTIDEDIINFSQYLSNIESSNLNPKLSTSDLEFIQSEKDLILDAERLVNELNNNKK